MKVRTLSALLVVLAAAAAPAHAAQHHCVSLSVIDQTPAIDESTVLIKLRGHGHFMRMDLAGRCPGLTFNGFMHEARQNELCTSDPLRVIEPVGAVCMIDKIVDITPDEAHALLQRKQ
jgi:hypothetical protein